ncbi:MAG: hypothetical protein AB2693_15615, partial [Candidatus Thiodiazotropha sp.]
TVLFGENFTYFFDDICTYFWEHNYANSANQTLPVGEHIDQGFTMMLLAFIFLLKSSINTIKSLYII